MQDCWVDIKMSALLLISAGLQHVAWVWEQVGLLNFTPEFDRPTYPGIDVAEQPLTWGLAS